MPTRFFCPLQMIGGKKVTVKVLNVVLNKNIMHFCMSFKCFKGPDALDCAIDLSKSR